MAEATRWWAAAVAGCVIGLAAVAGSVLVALREENSPDAPAGWQRLPDSPLGPRSEVVGAWAGEEVLFVGGSTYTCPPAADCGGPIGPYFADGAALDPNTGEWRTIAPTPVAFGQASTAVIGDDVYFLTVLREPFGNALLHYSISDDSWDMPPVPPIEIYSRLLAAGDQLIAYGDEAFAFDRATERWAALPAAPNSASISGTMVYSGGDLYLLSTGSGLMPERPPLVTIARLELESMTWASLPDSEIRGNDPWFVNGDLLVNPVVDTTAGAIARWPDNPYGGIFDTASERWLPLPRQSGDPPDTLQASRTAGVLGTDGALYLEPYGWPIQGRILELSNGDWIEMTPLDAPDWLTQRHVVTAGRDAVVLGGARWTGRSPASRGEVLADVWIWRPGR